MPRQVPVRSCGQLVDSTEDCEVDDCMLCSTVLRLICKNGQSPGRAGSQEKAPPAHPPSARSARAVSRPVSAVSPAACSVPAASATSDRIDRVTSSSFIPDKLRECEQTVKLCKPWRPRPSRQVVTIRRPRLVAPSWHQKDRGRGGLLCRCSS